MVKHKYPTNTALGRSIINKRFQGQQNRNAHSKKGFHRSDGDFDDEGNPPPNVQQSSAKGVGLKSITEENHLDHFLNSAALADRNFEAERLNTRFISPQSLLPTVAKLKRIEQTQKEFVHILKIPRRPFYEKGVSQIEQDKRERDMFLTWRKEIAEYENPEIHTSRVVEGTAKFDDLIFTPYEKNLEIWRQLWRVVERSDILMQIVDARNPLLFYCPDLDSYVREVSPKKQTLLLLNKSDYLSSQQKKAWAEFFAIEGITVAFFSAAANHVEKGDEKKEADDDGGDANGSDDEDNQSSLHPVLSVSELLTLIRSLVKRSIVHCPSDHSSSSSIENVNSASEEGLSEIKIRDYAHLSESSVGNDDYDTRSTDDSDIPITIGMVGYPNVGKSSTINALLQSKKTSVSATPGKTKHFQTIHLEPNRLILCDCPGLVFPSFVTTRAEMILNGILSIDEMKDHLSPCALLCERIPRKTLEILYGISLNSHSKNSVSRYDNLDDEYKPSFSSNDLLNSYASVRGYFTATHGIPDTARAARQILKDYVNGILLYCHPPPHLSSQVKFDFFLSTKTSIKLTSKLQRDSNSLAAKYGGETSKSYHTDREIVAGGINNDEQSTTQLNDFDAKFFKSLSIDDSDEKNTKRNFNKKRSQLSEIDLSKKSSKKTEIKTITRMPSDDSSLNTNIAGNTGDGSKSWKKHHNRKKKEKLRRLYKHLDA